MIQRRGPVDVFLAFFRLLLIVKLELTIRYNTDSKDLISQVWVASCHVLDPTMESQSSLSLLICDRDLIDLGEVCFVDNLVDETLLGGEHETLLMV